MGGFGERAGERTGWTIGVEERVEERMRGASGGDTAAHEDSISITVLSTAPSALSAVICLNTQPADFTI
jgi:hypothetical protein